MASASPRRSSRRGDDSDMSPNFGLSKNETAFSVLRSHVLAYDFKPIKDPDNAMKKIWIRNGKEKENDNDGVDWIKEDGFTVKKYEEFWRNEMAELEDVIVEWGHKLPAEAKSHLDRSLFEDDDEDDIKPEKAAKAAKVCPGSENEKRKSSGKKRGRGRPRKLKPNAEGDVKSAISKASGKKRGRPRKQKSDADDDGKDGLTPELRGLRKEWFGALEKGQYKVGVEEARKTTSNKKIKEHAGTTANLFLHNVARCPKATQYKQVALDPLAKHIMAKIDAHVANQATILRNQLLEELVLTNYSYTKEDKVNYADGDKINDDDGDKVNEKNHEV